MFSATFLPWMNKVSSAMCEAAPKTEAAVTGTTDTAVKTQEGGASELKESKPAAAPKALFSPLSRIAKHEKLNVRKPLPNPGQYESLQRDSRGILNLPDCFDGFQCSISKPLTQQFQVSHGLVMGTSMIPKQLGSATYNFGANVALKGGEIILVSRVDKMGRVEGRYMHKDLLIPNSMTKLITQVSAEEGQSVCYGEVDIGGSDWSAQGKFGNMGGGMYMTAGNYLQSITKSTSVGVDFQYLPARNMCVSRFGCRTYGALDKLTRKPGWCVSGEYNTQGKLICHYSRPVTQRLSMASEFNLNTNDKNSKVSFGYKYTLAQSIIQGSITSQGLTKVSVKEIFNPALSCSVSAEIDHKRGGCKVGYGINIGQ